MSKTSFIVVSLTIALCLLIDSSNAQECKAKNLKKRVLCYYANWAQWRPSPGNIKTSDFDPCLCTHVIYAFVPIGNNQLKPTTDDTNLLGQMAAWRSKNPNIKIILSVGGWGAGNDNFISIVSTDQTRTSFCNMVIDFARANNLDGFDIDWEFPTVQYKDQYTAFVKTCYDLFVAEAAKSGKPRLSLSAATAPDSRYLALDLPQLNKYFDFLNPMTYDEHGSWDGNTKHHSPLHGTEGSATTLKNYIAGGFDAAKLNLGFATYGRTLSVTGDYTREAGILSYFEICKMMTSGSVKYDDALKVPNCQINSQTCFYDNPQSVADKTQWALDNGIGGIFTWDASMDDFNGQFCNQGKFPLISAGLNKLYAAESGNSSTIITTIAATTTTKAPVVTTVTTKAPIATTKPAVSTTTIKPVATTTTAKPTGSAVDINTLCAGKIGFISDPTNCGRYFSCSSVGNNVMSCSTGLYWNNQIKACDWPANVKCP